MPQVPPHAPQPHAPAGVGLGSIAPSLDCPGLAGGAANSSMKLRRRKREKKKKRNKKGKKRESGTENVRRGARPSEFPSQLCKPRRWGLGWAGAPGLGPPPETPDPQNTPSHPQLCSRPRSRGEGVQGGDEPPRRVPAMIGGRRWGGDPRKDPGLNVGWMWGLRGGKSPKKGPSLDEGVQMGGTSPPGGAQPWDVAVQGFRRGGSTPPKGTRPGCGGGAPQDCPSPGYGGADGGVTPSAGCGGDVGVQRGK